MIEGEAHRQAEAVALGMGITIYVVKATFFQPPDDRRNRRNGRATSAFDRE
jgi:hypothetical protein